jgi:hypothetical protein
VIWLALMLILLSFIVTIAINRKVLNSDDKTCSIIKTDKISPIIGLSAIIIGTTLMVGYILVSYLGKLGLYLAETLKTWIS